MSGNALKGEGPENVMPYGGEESKTGQVRGMFDSIARRYDLMNAVMTFGLYRRWRDKIFNRHLSLPESPKILDIATGTGDLAIKAAEVIPNAEITGIDLSEGMLSVAREKVGRKGIKDVEFLQADCLHLPFGDEVFDVITVAYGVRNFESLLAGYKEMFRVLKPGGKLFVIELSCPENRILRAGYNLYSKGLIPIVGNLVSGDSRAYSYLPESIAACPQREDMCALMRKAGFSGTSFRTMTFGVVSLYEASRI